MPDSPKPLLRFQPDRQWVNKHGNVRATPKRLYDVWNRWADQPVVAPRWKAGLAAVQEIIRTAEQGNLSVRGLGGGWSLSDAAVTPDFMANTKPLNFLEIGFRPENCAPGFADKCDRLVFAQCGISVLELNLELQERGFSLATSGASNGQTICGAISTGTHGSANQIGSMQDFILGLHLVTEGGKSYWIEPKSKPAVTESFCKKLGAELKQSDELFNAVRVSFGSFGIIHAVLFLAEEIYLLEKYVQHFDYAAVRDVIGTLDVTSLALKGGPGLPYHFGIVVDPYATGAGEKGAYVTWMFKRDFEQIPAPPEEMVTTVPGDDLLAVIGGISDAVPELIPLVVGKLLASEMPVDLSGKRATHGATFGATNLTPGGLSCELGVALADAPRAVDAIIAVAKQHPFAGAIALRFVAASDALLAFTKFAPYTCTMELVMVASDRSRAAYELIWNALEQQGIPHTFHWGQCMRPSFQHLQDVFGERLQKWLAARRGFLSEKGRRTFANDLMRRCGIDA